MKIKITSDQWNFALATLEDQEDGGVSVREHYSGRYMYGETCVGVVGEGKDLIRFMIALVEQLSPEDVDDQKQTMIDMAGSMRTDNMGHSTIFYFPGWQIID